MRRWLVYTSTNTLTLVTFERLISIRFTVHYTYIVTEKNIKIAIISFWIFAFASAVLRRVLYKAVLFIIALVLISCVIFTAFSYAILYRETLRHQKMIKSQQLPQEAVERYVKENKALKTAVLLVGAVVLCFLPAFSFIVQVIIWQKVHLNVLGLWASTSLMLNSLLNPLIYCWRQKEMRRFVFRRQTQLAVFPSNLNS